MVKDETEIEMEIMWSNIKGLKDNNAGEETRSPKGEVSVPD